MKEKSNNITPDIEAAELTYQIEKYMTENDEDFQSSLTQITQNIKVLLNNLHNGKLQNYQKDELCRILNISKEELKTPPSDNPCFLALINFLDSAIEDRSGYANIDNFIHSLTALYPNYEVKRALAWVQYVTIKQKQKLSDLTKVQQEKARPFLHKSKRRI